MASLLFGPDEYTEESTLHIILEGKDFADVGGWFGSTDPFFVLYASAPTAKGTVLWQSVYTSEEIPNTLHPRWKKAQINLNTLCGGKLINVHKPIRIAVIDWEPSEKHNPIGVFDTTVDELLQVSGDASKTAPLRSEKGEVMGYLIVRLARVKTPRPDLIERRRSSIHSRRKSSIRSTRSIKFDESLMLLQQLQQQNSDGDDDDDDDDHSSMINKDSFWHVTLEGQNLVDVADWFQTTNPYFQVAIPSTSPTDASCVWQTVFRSNHVQESLNPVWAEANINLYLLCGGDLKKPFRVFVFSRVDEGKGKPKSMGYFETNVAEMMKAVNHDSKSFTLVDDKGKEYGKIAVLHAQLPDDFSECSHDGELIGAELQANVDVGENKPTTKDNNPHEDTPTREPADAENNLEDGFFSAVTAAFGFIVGGDEQRQQRPEVSNEPARLNLGDTQHEVSEDLEKLEKEGGCDDHSLESNWDDEQKRVHDSSESLRIAEPPSLAAESDRAKGSTTTAVIKATLSTEELGSQKISFSTYSKSVKGLRKILSQSQQDEVPQRQSFSGHLRSGLPKERQKIPLLLQPDVGRNEWTQSLQVLSSNSSLHSESDSHFGEGLPRIPAAPTIAPKGVTVDGSEVSTGAEGDALAQQEVLSLHARTVPQPEETTQTNANNSGLVELHAAGPEGGTDDFSLLSDDTASKREDIDFSITGNPTTLNRVDSNEDRPPSQRRSSRRAKSSTHDAVSVVGSKSTILAEHENKSDGANIANFDEVAAKCMSSPSSATSAPTISLPQTVGAQIPSTHVAPVAVSPAPSTTTDAFNDLDLLKQDNSSERSSVSREEFSTSCSHRGFVHSSFVVDVDDDVDVDVDVDVDDDDDDSVVGQTSITLLEQGNVIPDNLDSNEEMNFSERNLTSTVLVSHHDSAHTNSRGIAADDDFGHTSAAPFELLEDKADIKDGIVVDNSEPDKVVEECTQAPSSFSCSKMPAPRYQAVATLPAPQATPGIVPATAALPHHVGANSSAAAPPRFVNEVLTEPFGVDRPVSLQKTEPSIEGSRIACLRPLALTQDLEDVSQIDKIDSEQRHELDSSQDRCDGGSPSNGRGSTAKPRQDVVSSGLHDDATVYLTLSGRDFPNLGGWFGLSATNPFFEIECIVDTSPEGTNLWQIVYTSEPIDNELNPNWKEAPISFGMLCNADLDRPIRISVFSWKEGEAHTPMGSYESTTRQLLQAAKDDSHFFVPEEDGKCFGKVLVADARIEHEGLSIQNEERLQISPTFVLTLQGKALVVDKGWFGVPEVQFRVSASTDMPDGTLRWKTVYSSEYVKNKANPIFRQAPIDMVALCGESLDRPIRISLFDRGEQGALNSMGFVDTTPQELLSLCCEEERQEDATVLSVTANGRVFGCLAVLEAFIAEPNSSDNRDSDPKVSLREAEKARLNISLTSLRKFSAETHENTDKNTVYAATPSSRHDQSLSLEMVEKSETQSSFTLNQKLRTDEQAFSYSAISLSKLEDGEKTSQDSLAKSDAGKQERCKILSAAAAAAAIDDGVDTDALVEKNIQEKNMILAYCKRLEEQVASLEKSVAEKDVLLMSATAKTDCLLSEKQALEVECALSARQLKEMLDAKNRMEEVLIDSKAEVLSYKRDLERASAKVSEMERQYQGLADNEEPKLDSAGLSEPSRAQEAESGPAELRVTGQPLGTREDVPTAEGSAQEHHETIAALTAENGVLSQMVATLEQRVGELQRVSHERIVADSRTVASSLTQNSMLDRKTLETSLAEAEFKVQSYAAAMLAEDEKMRALVAEKNELVAKALSFKRVAEKNFKTVQDAKGLLGRYKEERKKLVQQKAALKKSLKDAKASVDSHQLQLKEAERKYSKLESSLNSRNKLIENEKARMKALQEQNSILESRITEMKRISSTETNEGAKAAQGSLEKPSGLRGKVGTKAFGAAKGQPILGCDIDAGIETNDEYRTLVGDGNLSSAAGGPKTIEEVENNATPSWISDKEALLSRIKDLEANFEKANVEREAAIKAKTLYEGFWKDAKNEFIRLQNKATTKSKTGESKGHTQPDPFPKGSEFQPFGAGSSFNFEDPFKTKPVATEVGLEPSQPNPKIDAFWVEPLKSEDSTTKQQKKATIKRNISMKSSLKLSVHDNRKKPTSGKSSTGEKTEAEEEGQLSISKDPATGKSSAAHEKGKIKPPGSKGGSTSSGRFGRKLKRSKSDTTALKNSKKKRANLKPTKSRPKRSKSEGSVPSTTRNSPAKENETSKASTRRNHTSTREEATVLLKASMNHQSTEEGSGVAESPQDGKDSVTDNKEMETPQPRGRETRVSRPGRKPKRPSSAKKRRPSSTSPGQLILGAERRQSGKKSADKMKRSKSDSAYNRFSTSNLRGLAPVPVHVSKLHQANLRRTSYRVARKQSMQAFDIAKQHAIEQTGVETVIESMTDDEIEMEIAKLAAAVELGEAQQDQLECPFFANVIDEEEGNNEGDDGSSFDSSSFGSESDCNTDGGDESDDSDSETELSVAIPLLANNERSDVKKKKKNMKKKKKTKKKKSKKKKKKEPMLSEVVDATSSTQSRQDIDNIESPEPKKENKLDKTMSFFWKKNAVKEEETPPLLAAEEAGATESSDVQHYLPTDLKTEAQPRRASPAHLQNTSRRRRTISARPRVRRSLSSGDESVASQQGSRLSARRQQRSRPADASLGK